MSLARVRKCKQQFSVWLNSADWFLDVIDTDSAPKAVGPYGKFDRKYDASILSKYYL